MMFMSNQIYAHAFNVCIKQATVSIKVLFIDFLFLPSKWLPRESDCALNISVYLLRYLFMGSNLVTSCLLSIYKQISFLFTETLKPQYYLR